MPTPKPNIMLVDDDEQDLNSISRELHKRYGTDYDIICEKSAQAALYRLEALNAADAQVAVILADLWMPEMTGVEFLNQAHELHPQAKRTLLIEWGDSASTEPILQAATLGWIDLYAVKPLTMPDERFHRHITEQLDEWSRRNQQGAETVQVVGEQWSPRSHEFRDILDRFGIPFGFYDVNSEKGQALLKQAGQPNGPFPVVIMYTGQVLVNPTNQDVADAFGVNERFAGETFDLVIVGAGPSGLSAAVYGASEGLRTMVVEREVFGGQAGTSSHIRNYLGFPNGISGRELANRAYLQAFLFGTQFYFLQKATGLRAQGDKRILTLSDGVEIVSKAVVLAMGARYRKLGIDSCECFDGAGVFYGGTITEAQAMKGQKVFVAGAGNAAGQAAVHLASYAELVTLLVRGESLETSMSDYLIKEIEATDNIEVRLNTSVIAGEGNRRLERLVLQNTRTGGTDTVDAAALFVLIGAEPHTNWLPESILRDKKGFVLTGADFVRTGKPPEGWSLDRQPYLFETSMSGVFAVGDVRHRSVKRIASAVGEGGIAIQLVHEYLRDAHK
jgi:thioredoxin reductase (NADPH)